MNKLEKLEKKIKKNFSSYEFIRLTEYKGKISVMLDGEFTENDLEIILTALKKYRKYKEKQE